MKLSANDILKLLAERHRDDLFLDEVKTGPSGRNVFRMDAWAMKKSWAQPNTYGYEIKVDRGDFLRDNKWPNYLPYCSDFYFVCPAGIIQPEELPAEAGLLTVTSTGTRLLTKKKAATRMDSIPEDLYRYILMWRCQITRETTSGRERRMQHLREWLAGKRETRDLGYAVSYRIAEKLRFLENENRDKSRTIEDLEQIWEILKRAGFDPKAGHHRYAVERFLRNSSQGLTADHIEKLQSAAQSINEVLRHW